MTVKKIPKCPECGEDLKEDKDEWYCEKCDVYFDEDLEEEEDDSYE